MIISPTCLSSCDNYALMINDIYNKHIDTQDPRISQELWDELMLSTDEDNDMSDTKIDETKTIHYKIISTIGLNWNNDPYAIQHWIPGLCSSKINYFLIFLSGNP
jgi:hypothetical protein